MSESNDLSIEGMLVEEEAELVPQEVRTPICTITHYFLSSGQSIHGPTATATGSNIGLCSSDQIETPPLGVIARTWELQISVPPLESLPSTAARVFCSKRTPFIFVF